LPAKSQLSPGERDLPESTPAPLERDCPGARRRAGRSERLDRRATQANWLISRGADLTLHLRQLRHRDTTVTADAGSPGPGRAVLEADSYAVGRASDSKRRASTLSMRPYSTASAAVMK